MVPLVSKLQLGNAYVYLHIIYYEYAPNVDIGSERVKSITKRDWMKILKWLKEIIFVIILIFIVTNIISFYRFEAIEVDIKNTINKEADIVYFWGDWCPVCKMEKSQIDFVSKRLKVTKVAFRSKSHKGSINDDGRLVSIFKVKAYPTIFYIKDNKVVYSDTGYTSAISILLKHYIFRLIK